jgi:hypothetical protein
VIVHFVDINGIVGTSLFKLSFPNLPSKYNLSNELFCLVYLEGGYRQIM